MYINSKDEDKLAKKNQTEEPERCLRGQKAWGKGLCSKNRVLIVGVKCKPRIDHWNWQHE